MAKLHVCFGYTNRETERFGIRNRSKKPLMLGVIFCYALIRNNINNSAICSSNAALLNFKGPTTCRGHPILSIVVLSDGYL